MKSRSGNKAGVRAVGLGLLAVAGGALGVQGARVFCRFVSATRTRIQYQDGYADALIDIAESICSEATGQPRLELIRNSESISAVAAAQAAAIADVIGTCAGDRSNQLQVRAADRAEVQATAVGLASADIVASSGVCGLCETGLQSFAVAVETLTSSAVAGFNLHETAQCNGEPITVGVVEQLLRADIAGLLSTAIGDVRSSALDTCSNSTVASTVPPASPTVCDVAISADDIGTEIAAVADAGLELQGLACGGVDSSPEVDAKLREVATAVAQAVTQASAFCETNGGPGTMACGLTRSTIDAVANATAEAFTTGLAKAYGPECGCDLAERLDAEDAAAAVAQACATSLIEVCAGSVDFASSSEFQIRAEVKVAEAVAKAVLAAAGGDCAAETSHAPAPAMTPSRPRSRSRQGRTRTRAAAAQPPAAARH